MTTEFETIREVCALLGKPKVKQFNENFETTIDVVSTPINKSEVPALFKPKKLLGDYDVSAGFEGTPEVTQKYLSATPGQTIHEKTNQLNNVIENFLKENTNMDTSYSTDEGGKLKSFAEFPIVQNYELEQIAQNAATPAVITLDFKGTKIHTALLGDHKGDPLPAATTIDMNTAKERALKRLAEFVSSYHGNNQQSIKTKEV